MRAVSATSAGAALQIVFESRVWKQIGEIGKHSESDRALRKISVARDRCLYVMGQHYADDAPQQH